MSDSSQVAVGFPIEFQSIEIPKEVEQLTITRNFITSSAEYFRGQHIRRTVRLVETDWFGSKKDVNVFFKHETEGLDYDDESEYIHLLATYLNTLGFRMSVMSDILGLDTQAEKLIWLSRANA